MAKKNNYSSVKYPTPDGKSTRHRPRRNYWGNLYDEDTYDEDRHRFNDNSPRYMTRRMTMTAIMKVVDMIKL